MPKTHRQLIQRKLAQGVININYAGTYFHEIAEEYRPVHPELAEALDNALYGLAMVTDIAEKFAMAISGAPNINWNTWAGTNRPTHDDSIALSDDGESDSANESDTTETDKGLEDGN